MLVAKNPTGIRRDVHDVHSIQIVVDNLVINVAIVVKGVEARLVLVMVGVTIGTEIGELNGQRVLPVLEKVIGSVFLVEKDHYVNSMLDSLDGVTNVGQISYIILIPWFQRGEVFA